MQSLLCGCSGPRPSYPLADLDSSGGGWESKAAGSVPPPCVAPFLAMRPTQPCFQGQPHLAFMGKFPQCCPAQMCQCHAGPVLGGEEGTGWPPACPTASPSLARAGP